MRSIKRNERHERVKSSAIMNQEMALTEETFSLKFIVSLAVI